MFSAALPLRPQHLPDLRSPIDALTNRMDGWRPSVADGLELRDSRATLPGIIPARGDPEEATHQAQRNHGATMLDHGIPYREVLPKNADAPFKKSRSRVTRASLPFEAGEVLIVWHSSSWKGFRPSLSGFPATAAPTWPH